jgi:hypothetical protein
VTPFGTSPGQATNPMQQTVTLHADEDLSGVVQRLVAFYGVDRQRLVEAIAGNAWLALRTINDRADRLVTAERLARIELNAHLHAQMLSHRREECMVHT